MRSYYFLIKPNKVINNKIPTNFLTKKLSRNYYIQFVNFLNKVGYKKNFIKKILKWGSVIYSKNNKISDELTYNIQKNIKYNNLSYLFNSILEKSEINFKLVCAEVDKKYRKKLKKKYTFKLNYLNKDKKRLFFFKNLKHIMCKDNQRTIFHKISNTLNNALINFKKTELYKLKILTLKQLTQKK